MNIKVSFDFDYTLSESHIQEYARELIERGYEVWIVTSRLDAQHYAEEFKTTLYYGELANKDLFEVANKLGIPEDRIKFTNFQSKWMFLQDKDFALHLDDDFNENRGILNHTRTRAVNSYGNSSWRIKCERALNERIK